MAKSNEQYWLDKASEYHTWLSDHVSDCTACKGGRSCSGGDHYRRQVRDAEALAKHAGRQHN